MESALSRLPLGFAVVCLLVYVLGATYAAAAFAQEGAPQATLSSLTATGSTITVTGFVVPGGSVTSFVIDYGTTSSSLGQSTSPVSIGSLPQPIPVNQTLSGLTAGTTYYVQIVATSSAGTGSSAVMSATTSGSAPAAPSPTGVQLSASALPHLGLEQDQLAGVSCVSGSFCFAVGQGGSHLKSSGGVAERFNGRSWSGLAGRLGGSESSLESVSCLSSSFCIAVGHTKNGTLAERFNGRFWSRVESVSPAGPGADALNSVSCISRRDCWAAGYIHGGLNTPAGSLVEHYDGHAFTVTSTPRDRGYLTSVSCATSAYCWAVGDHGADHYDGHAWKPVSLPGSLSSHLSTAVSCRSVSACWIVGASAPGGSPPSPLALHLVGGSWRVVKMPDGPFQATNYLDEVACATASECWAVGGSLRGSPGSTPTEAPLAEQWNGSTWTLARVSAPPGQLGSFSGVSCPASGACVAVGLLGSASQSAGFIGSAMFAVSQPSG